MENKKEMKTYRYYIMTLVLSLFVAGCSEDEITKRPSANVGDEVKFGLSLPGLSIRTIYGDEDYKNKCFPIYWVDGDLVKVASPQCLSGRNSAEYSISAGEKQNYATSMTKTGAFGVQWGETATADFYSIYPSTGGTELKVTGNNVSAKLHVDATQYASTTDYVDSCYAQPANMGNVVMYAVTKNVLNTAEAVELRYKPFSTVIEFEITAPNTNSGNQKSEITIQSLTLVAPTNTSIAGDFTFTFPADDKSNPSATANDGGSNAITLHFLDNNQYTTKLSTTKQKLKAKMCLMPISKVPSEGWTVALNTSAGTFVKNITLGDLTAGLVHKIKLPKLNYASEEWKYSLANWITSLPDYKNIYLSEISLPGAWYAGSDEAYQETSDIARLWNAGVRAFAVETKTTSTGYTPLFGSPIEQTEPSGVVLSGSQNNSDIRHSAGTNSLGTGSSSRATVCWSGTSISTIITNIVNRVKADEYGVLVLSYADGGESGHRAVDYGAWLQLLYGVYNGLDDAVKAKIYQNEITANTTVNDVLGKLILKINVDANIAMTGSVSSTNYAYGNNLPALFSYNPFLFQMEGEDMYSVPFFSNLSWKTWGDDKDTHRTYFRSSTAQTMENPFIWCFSSANRTQADGGTNTTIPTYAQRQSALGAMMTYSRQIYEASTHNVWFYFNCGGTLATSSDSKKPSPTKFAKTMNLWLKNTINDKTDPSPLGIVMFNQCTGANATYYGEDIIKAIVEMNSKFYLKHAGANTGSSTGGTATQESAVKSAAPGYSAGMVDKKTNAISWESSE